jgi:hypothetical protein
MTPALDLAAASPDGRLRVERIFADTYALILRHGAPYLALTLLFGVGPSLLISSLCGLPPGDLSAAPLGMKLASMGLFILGDAVLGGALAQLVFDDLAGRPGALTSALGAARRGFWPLLVTAAAIDTPILLLNLASNAAPHDAATMLTLYGLRFCFAMTLGAVWAGAAAAVAAEPGLSGLAALKRAARLTTGHRKRTALFFAAFFILKVLGPYLLVEVGLQHLAAWLGNGAGVRTACALAGMLVWNLLACALGVSGALIYAALRRLHGEAAVG